MRNLKSSITLKRIGGFLVLFSLVLLVLVFYPIVLKELAYIFNKPNSSIDVITTEEINSYDNLNDLLAKAKNKEVILSADEDFSIVIPKIGVNTRVINNVDPNDSSVYQQELTKGVAHAKDTSLPDEKGNTFLFAHSSDSFYNANRFNSVFYLLHRLEKEDIFYIVYKGVKYKYKIVEKSIVAPEAVQYMSSYSNIETSATLMTCWPAGTTLNRLVVVGKSIL